MIYYDDKRYEFLVLTPGSRSALLFVRKFRMDGKPESPYYTYDMRDPDTSIAVHVDTRYTSIE